MNLRFTREWWCWVAVVMFVCGCTSEMANIEDREVSPTLVVGIHNLIGERATRGVLANNFPTSFAGTVSKVGVLLMEDDAPFKPGTDNLLAQVTGRTGANPVYAWSYFQSDGTTPYSWRFPVSSSFDVYAYYPWTSATTEGKVPFDLSVVATEEEQKDYLYTPVTRVTIPDATATSIPLNFSHAFALVELKLKISSASVAVNVQQVVVRNAEGKSLVINKGALDLKAEGSVVNGVSGEVGVSCNKTLTNSSYTTFQILVPPFSGAFANGDVYVCFLNGEGAEITRLLMKQDYLSDLGNGNYGLKKGLKYSYQLLYDNEYLVVEEWSKSSKVSDNFGQYVYEYNVTAGGQLEKEPEWAGSNVYYSPMDDRLTFDVVGKASSPPGLYFTYGSLAGINARTDVVSGDPYFVVFSPEEYTSAVPTEWNLIMGLVPDWYGGFQSSVKELYSSYPTSLHDPRGSVGDICRYISEKKWVNGRWRMPTRAELEHLFKKGITASRGSSFPDVSNTFDRTGSNPSSLQYNVMTITGTQLLFPATGKRVYSANGAVQQYGKELYYWGAATSGSTANSYQVVSSTLTWSLMNSSDCRASVAVPVRCVKDPRD